MQTEMIKSELLAQDRPRLAREEDMNTKQNDDPEMLEEYDFSGGVRGKYVDRLAARQNLITLEPDVAEVLQTLNPSIRHCAGYFR